MSDFFDFIKNQASFDVKFFACPSCFPMDSPLLRKGGDLSMRLGQLRADRQVLRAQPLTPAAAVALVGPGLGLHSLPIPAGDRVVLIHGHTVDVYKRQFSYLT